MVRSSLLALLLLGACAAAPPPVAEHEACRSPGEIAANLTKALTPSKTEVLTGKQAQNFIVAYNAEPPESDIQADQVTIFTHGDGPAVLLFGKEGCLVEHFFSDRPYVEDLLAKVRGKGA